MAMQQVMVIDIEPLNEFPLYKQHLPRLTELAFGRAQQQSFTTSLFICAANS